MSKFLCDICNYSSNSKFSYEKHLKTKKHLENIKDPELSINSNYICQFCNGIYSANSNLCKHQKFCSKKKELFIELQRRDEEIARLKQENSKNMQFKDELLVKSNEMISILKSEVNHLQLVVNNSGSIVKTTVSALSYVVKNYTEAPVLEPCMNYKEINYEQNNTEFIEKIIYEHNNGNLPSFIGEFIIKNYKKDDPQQQSLWSSDTVRFSYLVRELINNNTVDWKIDKNGIKTKETIIKPIVQYIDDQVREYMEHFDIDYTNNSAVEAEKKMMKLKLSADILKDADDGVLSTQILKYITPFFYLNKTDDVQPNTIINNNISINK